LAKKTLANVNLHRQSKINSKTKLNEAIPNYSFARVARPLFWHMQGVIEAPVPSDNFLAMPDYIRNIDEHNYNKTNSVFSRIYLVPRASSVLFDDGEVNCSPNI